MRLTSMLVTGALLLLTSREASADPLEAMKSWRLCGVGVTYTTCTQLEVYTKSWMHNGAPVGTEMSIVLRNLQGSIAEDTSPWSSLVGFTIKGAPTNYTPVGRWFYGATPFGGAVGSWPWLGINMYGSYDTGSPTMGHSAFAFGQEGGLLGCASAPYSTPGITSPQTCGSQQGFRATVFADNDYRADGFNEVYLTWGTEGGSHSCGYNQSQQYYSDCFVPSATVTPEPATLALFASGIGGLGLFRFRRRKA